MVKWYIIFPISHKTHSHILHLTNVCTSKQYVLIQNKSSQHFQSLCALTVINSKHTNLNLCVSLSYSIGKNSSRVAVATFSTRAKVSFHLNQHFTKKDLIKAVMDTRYHYGDTNTAGGLELLRQKVFTGSHGDRVGVQNIAILVTDGVSINRSYFVP